MGCACVSLSRGVLNTVEERSFKTAWPDTSAARAASPGERRTGGRARPRRLPAAPWVRSIWRVPRPPDDLRQSLSGRRRWRHGLRGLPSCNSYPPSLGRAAPRPPAGRRGLDATRDRGRERGAGRLGPEQALLGTGLPVAFPDTYGNGEGAGRHESLRKSPKDPHLPREPQQPNTRRNRRAPNPVLRL